MTYYWRGACPLGFHALGLKTNLKTCLTWNQVWHEDIRLLMCLLQAGCLSYICVNLTTLPLVYSPLKRHQPPPTPLSTAPSMYSVIFCMLVSWWSDGNCEKNVEQHLKLVLNWDQRRISPSPDADVEATSKLQLLQTETFQTFHHWKVAPKSLIQLIFQANHNLLQSLTGKFAVKCNSIFRIHRHKHTHKYMHKNNRHGTSGDCWH